MCVGVFVRKALLPRARAGMFSLIMGFWSYLFRKTELQILIVGLDGAGKTVWLPSCPPARRTFCY
jgi:hypothetical protein